MRSYFTLVSILVLLSPAGMAQPAKMATLPAIMNEISGVCIADNSNVLLYMHNDSGDTSRIFAIGKDGNLSATLYFTGYSGKKGVTDCEDIAHGKGGYIYLGDIGDNGASRPYIAVYRIKEPAKINGSEMTISAEPVFLRYPDGPRDAETLMIDDTENLLYIISKREDTVSIYTAPLAWQINDTMMLQKRGTRLFPGTKPAKWISGGDISADGKQVILKSYLKVFYWKRKKNEPVWQTLQRPAMELPYHPEPQGEAICFDKKGQGYYTVSEGDNQPVYYYRIRKKGAKD